MLGRKKDKLYVRAVEKCDIKVPSKCGATDVKLVIGDGFDDESPVTHRAVLAPVQTRLQTQMKTPFMVCEVLSPVLRIVKKRAAAPLGQLLDQHLFLVLKAD